jgi:prepilin-type N-terminal cleavage/methylation domain-containing protein
MRRPHPPTRRDDGFSLVEVVVALAIFLLVSVATVAVVINAQKAATGNSDRIIAANIARSQLEELRALGAANITVGETTSVGGPNNAFTVTTTANWVGLGASGSACDAVTPGNAYVRVSVQVTGPSLREPQEIDSIISPKEVTDTSTSASVAIAVRDESGAPVSGVRVTVTDPLYSANVAKFPLTTGKDGCLFVTGLTSPPAAPTTLSVTVSRSGYVASTSTGATKSVILVQGTVAHLDFSYSAAATVRFAGQGGDYPLPSSFPVTWLLNATGEPLHTSQTGASVADVWPMPTGFSAWAGTCADADPAANGGTRVAYALSAGAPTLATVAGAPVVLTGLQPNQAVTLSYAGTDAGCSFASRTLGNATSAGMLKVSLPYGKWRFTAGGTSKTLPAPLTPAGAAVGPVLLAFA